MIWQAFLRLNILLVLVDQAAAQSAAHTGDLRRIQGNTLGLCHADRDRAELGQESRAATYFNPACTHPANDLGNIPGTDPAEINIRIWVGFLHHTLQWSEVWHILLLDIE